MKLSFSLTLVSLVLSLGITTTRAQDQAGDPYGGLAKFQFGQSRLPLASIEDQIRKTAPQDYPAIETKFLAILKAPETPKDAKRFICRWLAVVGSAECVPAVAELLTDADLSHPARIALQALPATVAGDALRAALPSVKGKLLVGVIASLGVRRDAQAVRPLGQLVENDDPQVAATSLAALGQIGTEEAALVLNSAKVPQALDRTLARARVTAASQLARSGKRAEAAVIFRSLMAASQPVAIRIAGLKGLVGALSSAEAARLVVDMVQGDDVAMRTATIAAYATSTDNALKDAVAAELPAMKPAGQLILLGVLADEPAVAARAVVLQVLKAAQDEKLRAAALECLARHGESSDVPLMVGLASGSPGPVADAARKALLRMGKPGIDDALVRLLESAPAAQRTVVLTTLADRRAESALPTLVRLLHGTDLALATEAAKALGVMGKIGQLKDLVDTIALTDNSGLRDTAEEAAKVLARRNATGTAAATVVIAGLEQATTIPARTALLRVLTHTGGDQALSAVLKATTDKDPDVRAAATRTLVTWPEASAASHLLELARTTSDPGQAVTALRDGCLRLAEMDEVPLAQRVSILRGVLEVAKRSEEKKRALGMLGDVPTLGALELVQATSKDPALQADAARSAIRLARSLGPVYSRQTLAALQAIKTEASSDQLRAQVEEAIKAVQNSGQSPEGFIMTWLLAGPYTQPDKDGNALFDLAFAPEKAGGQAEWRPATSSKSGLIELDKIMRGDNRVAYLKTEIASNQAQDALLEMGSDDGIKVWLNGKVVHANNAVRPCVPGSDKVKIKLKEGANLLLVKVTQGAGEWSACCRLRAPDGKELGEVSVSPNPE